MALGVKDPGQYPDYSNPEEGQLDPDEIERRLDRLLATGPLMVGGSPPVQQAPGEAEVSALNQGRGWAI